MANVQVSVPQGFRQLDTTIKTAVKNGIEDCTADLLRVASLRTPVDSTTLEQSGSSKGSSNMMKVTGQVSFKAMNGNYNYALKMDSTHYNLGEKSLMKSTGGVRSAFCSDSLKVGTGYLSDTADKCEKGYVEHIQSKIDAVIRTAGFGR